MATGAECVSVRKRAPGVAMPIDEVSVMVDGVATAACPSFASLAVLLAPMSARYG